MGLKFWTRTIAVEDIPEDGIDLLKIPGSDVPEAPPEWIHLAGGAGDSATLTDWNGDEITLTATALVESWSGRFRKLLSATGPVTLGTGTTAGAKGDPGDPGQPAFSTFTTFTQPASGANVNVTFEDSSWVTLGMILFTSAGGYYQNVDVGMGTPLLIGQVCLKNLGYAGYTAEGQSVTGTAIVPAGIRGAQGAPGSNGTNGTNGDDGADGKPSFTTTTGFTQPGAFSAVAAVVGDTSWMSENMIVFVSTGLFYSVGTITDATHVSLITPVSGTYPSAAPSTAIPNGAVITPAGPIGPVNTAYTPANPSHWTDPDPTTVAAALDRIAAVVSVAGGTPIP